MASRFGRIAAINVSVVTFYRWMSHWNLGNLVLCGPLRPFQSTKDELCPYFVVSCFAAVGSLAIILCLYVIVLIINFSHLVFMVIFEVSFLTKSTFTMLVKFHLYRLGLCRNVGSSSPWQSCNDFLSYEYTGHTQLCQCWASAFDYSYYEAVSVAIRCSDQESTLLD